MNTEGNTTTAQPPSSSERHGRIARIGHVNLSVSDLDRSLVFYQGVLNMKITKRIGDAAAFLAFDSYHHDLCINTWHSKGGAARSHGTTGLYHFAITFDAFETLQSACHCLLDAGVCVDEVVDHGTGLSVYVRDPDENGVELNWDRPRENWWSPGGSLTMGHKRITLDEVIVATISSVAAS